MSRAGFDKLSLSGVVQDAADWVRNGSGWSANGGIREPARSDLLVVSTGSAEGRH
jgi:hypothetical protein